MALTSRMQTVALHPSPQGRVDTRVKRAAGWGAALRDSPPVSSLAPLVRSHPPLRGGMGASGDAASGGL
jgi:hypothetical protein